MIAENISSVSKILRGLGGHVHEEVWEVLRQAAAVLDTSAEDVKNLEAAPLSITEPAPTPQQQ